MYQSSVVANVFSLSLFYIETAKSFAWMYMYMSVSLQSGDKFVEIGPCEQSRL